MLSIATGFRAMRRANVTTPRIIASVEYGFRPVDA